MNTPNTPNTPNAAERPSNARILLRRLCVAVWYEATNLNGIPNRSAIDALINEFGRELDAQPHAATSAGDEAVVEIGECAEVIWRQGGPCQLPPGTKLYLRPQPPPPPAR